MTYDQIAIFALLGGVLVFLVWGRLRYDVIAFVALVLAVLLGVVPPDRAFTGFGHPATITIAMVLIISRALSNSGAVDAIARTITGTGRSLTAHLALTGGVAGALSAVMNNVGALALFMPVEIQASAKAKRSPALTLMPLSFATILGGLVTLIGTPPNIIIAAYRETAVGAPFAMFDFTPVGAVTAVAGLIFVTFVGWRLIPVQRNGTATTAVAFDLEDYVAEAGVTEKSKAIDLRVRELDPVAEEHEVNVVGLIRRGRRLPGFARRETIRRGDVLVLEGGAEDIDRMAASLDLSYSRGKGDRTGLLRTEDLALMEVVVPPGARIDGRSAADIRLGYRYGVNLLGVSRQGRPFRERVRRLEIQAGDVLLLQGPAVELADVANRLGCLPLAARNLQVGKRGQAWTAGIAFAVAVAVASAGAVSLPVALAAAAAAMVLFGIVPLRELYETVEWPVIVLLGAMIPIGGALESTGGTQLITDGILAVSAGLPPSLVLVILMIITMTLSDVMNNTATAVIAAPIAVDVAGRLGVSADPFLMAVAVAASCAFLTPIGHKNNTLILGPGGYRFGDYWRMGLPLEVLIIAVSVPMILLVWPLGGGA